MNAAVQSLHRTASGSDLHARQIRVGSATDPALDAGLSAALVDLGLHALEPNVFHHPALLSAATLRAGRIQLHLLERAGDLVAALPVTRRSVGFGLAGRLPHVLTHDLGPIGTPHLRGGIAPEDLGGFLRHAASGAPALVFPFLHLGGPVAAALTAAAKATGATLGIHRDHQRGALIGRHGAEAYFAEALDKKRRRDWSRQRRRLEEMGELRLETATVPETIGPAMADFLELEARGWKGRQQSALKTDRTAAEFAERTVAALGASGDLRIDRLQLDGRTLAGLVTLKLGGSVWIWKTAYDEEFGKVSPGSQLLLDVTKAFLDDSSITFADSLAIPDHPLVNPIWADRMHVGTLVMHFGGGWIEQRVSADIRLYDQAKAQARRLLRR